MGKINAKYFAIVAACALSIAVAGCGSADDINTATGDIATETVENLTSESVTVAETESGESLSEEGIEASDDSFQTEESSNSLIDAHGAVAAEDAAGTSTANTGTSTNTSVSAGADTTASTGTITSTITSTSNSSVGENGFRKDVAQEIWSYVNAERTAAGLCELAWDDSIYEFACQRAQAIVTDFSHSGAKGYGENILMNHTTDAYKLHMQWYNSQGHHDNYMRADGYDKGACAVYVYNGAVYAVENFNYTPKTIDPDPVVSTWTASNGVIVEVYQSGSWGVGQDRNPGATSAELDAASNEYYEYKYGTGSSSSNQSTPSSSSSTETTTQTPVETQIETWTASNGVTVYIQNGNAFTRGSDGYSDDEQYQAWLEYMQSH